MSELSDGDRAVLDFAGRTYRHAGAQEQAIIDELGMTPARFYQRLRALLDRQEALAYAPSTVKRWRRLMLRVG
ncbi:MAG: DUF3263 domain-containing protein [Chloroflexi bacterium]|nr:DUF3263 domain-containing protein [Chloroflexota bacterium]